MPAGPRTVGVRRGCLRFAGRIFKIWRLRPVIVSSALIWVCFGCAASPMKRTELVWPQPPEQPRIRFIKSISSEADVEKPSFVSWLKSVVFGEEQKAGLAKPYAVHTDREGRIFVADSAWGKVLVFDAKNNSFFILGVDGPGVLSKPEGVTTDSAQRIYVTDVVERRAVVYDRNGKFLFAIGELGRFERPVGVALNEDLKRIYITDVRRHNVSVFNMQDGKFLFEFGGRGTEDGKFNFPINLAVDKNGRVYVMDMFNFRVQIFNADGKFESKFGSIGDGLGQFSKPKGIAVDSEGHIYVVDAAFNNVQIFDPEGRLLLFFGEFGSRNGQFWLPAGMDIDAHDRIYVADQYNQRIDIFQYLGERYKKEQQAQEKTAKAP
jgi:DNA-binding beta-propeller fold protein YncE